MPKAFPFDKMVPGMRDLEMIEDTSKIVNAGMNDKSQISLIINNLVGGNGTLIHQKIGERLRSEKQQKVC